MIGRVLRASSPGLVTLATLFYFLAVHVILYFETDAAFGVWLFVFALPPVAGELLFTRWFETRRHGWRWFVLAGLAGRFVLIGLLFYIFVFEAMRLADTPDVVLPLVSRWPGVLRVVWVASPWPSVVAAAVLLAVHALLTVRGRLGRYTTTFLLPGVATLGLFQLFYFLPDSPLRLERHERPDDVERVFPRGDTLPAALGERLYAREVHVSPDERFAVATFGATFGDDILGKPNLLQIDLATGEFRHHRFDTIRRFSSECSESVWFGPWHDAKLYEYRPAADRLTAHTLPSTINGFPVEEIMYAHHACDRGRVYAVNNRNPLVFVWDTAAGRLAGTVDLAQVPGLRVGDTAGVIARNAARGRFYVLLFGRYELAEVDEDTLAVTRLGDLPGDIADVKVSADGSWIYAPGMFRYEIYRVDAATLATTERFDAPAHCRHIALTPDDRHVLAASYLTGELVVLDARTGDERARRYVGAKPEGLYVTARHVYVLTAEGLFRIARGALGV